MKQASKFILSMVLFAGLALVACKKDNAINCANNFNISSEVVNELNGINAAASTYANDPSNANCENLKDAYRDYLSALRGLESCAKSAGVLVEWNQSITDAENSVDTIC